VHLQLSGSADFGSRVFICLTHFAVSSCPEPVGHPQPLSCSERDREEKERKVPLWLMLAVSIWKWKACRLQTPRGRVQQLSHRSYAPTSLLNWSYFFLHPASSSTGKEMSFVLLSLRKCAFACFSEEQNSAGTLKQVSFSPMPFIHVQAFPCVSKYGPLFTISL